MTAENRPIEEDLAHPIKCIGRFGEDLHQDPALIIRPVYLTHFPEIGQAVGQTPEMAGPQHDRRIEREFLFQHIFYVQRRIPGFFYIGFQLADGLWLGPGRQGDEY